jgi:N-acetylneuraminic acid mutarotase
MRVLLLALPIPLLAASSLPAAPPIAIKWETGPDLLQANAGGMTGMIGDDFIVAGGTFWHTMDSKRYISWTQIYNTKTGKWRMGPDLPRELAYSLAVTVDNKLYVFGGRGQGPEPLADGYVLSAVANPEKGEPKYEWGKAPSLPGPLMFPMGDAIGSVIYCIGGARDYEGKDVSQDLLALDTRNMDAGWKRLAPMPAKGVTNFAAAACGGNLYIFGGYRADTEPPINLAESYKYDVAADKWSEIHRLPFAARAQTAVAYDDRYILIMGFYVASDREVKFHGNDFGASGCVLLYDTQKDRYEVLQPMPRAVCEIFFARKGNMLYGAGGEWVYKIRSPFFFIGEIGPPIEEQ